MKHNVIHLKEYYDFCSVNKCDPTVAIYLPSDIDELHRENQKRPCILICPGGAYLFCSQKEAEPVAFHFLTEGYNVFVLNYSVAPNVFPEQLLEVAAVFDLIEHSADKWNCDIERTAIMGFSAGGHLAAHYTNRYNCKEVKDFFPNSRKVSASILCYPVISAKSGIAHKKSFQYLTGKEIDTEIYENFSCEMMVSSNTPPTFIWHTAADENVSVENSLIYTAALSKYNVPFEMHIYPFGSHGLATADSQTNNNLPEEYAHCADWVLSLKRWLSIIFNN